MKVRILLFLICLASQQMLGQDGNTEAKTNDSDSIQQNKINALSQPLPDSSQSKNPRVILKEKSKKLIRDTIKTASGDASLFQNNERLKKREAYEKRIEAKGNIAQEEVSGKYKQHLDKIKIDEKREKYHLSEGASKRAFSNVDKQKNAYSEKVKNYNKFK